MLGGHADPAVLAETSRDWWPLAMIWALDNQVGALASVVVRPSTADEVAAVLRICNEARVPVTPAAGRSGVCGASVPLHGGVRARPAAGSPAIVDVDAASMILDVRAGTFGDVLEDELRADHGVTVGHWPQSVELSTVGGWLACRGAGQYSTRYGKIEDIVVGLDVVLADGRAISTGGAPRAAVGPDLTQLFVGSEGTLGVITGARLRLHPTPAHRASRRLRVRARSPTGSTRADASSTAGRRPRSSGSTTTSRPSGTSRRRAGVHPLLVLDEGDPRAGRRDDDRRPRRVRLDRRPRR